MNAAFLNIITEWLSDIKLGYCTTAFYLNESFCCWGEDNGKWEAGYTIRAMSDNSRLSGLAQVEFCRICELHFIYSFCRMNPWLSF